MTRPYRVVGSSRTLGLVAGLVIGAASVASAQEKPSELVSSDAPVVVHLSEGGYRMNEPAFDALNNELTRLQGVERLHKDEQWGIALLVASLVGVAVGAVTVGLVVATQPKPAAP